MTAQHSEWFHDGVAQGLAAVGVATVTAMIIATSAPADDPLTGRLVIAGVGLFAVALALGSARVVGATSFLVLGSALAGSATADNPTWVQAIIVGCLWYVAVELAWDSIERRDGAERATTLDLRRLNEVTTIVVMALVITVSAYAASSLEVPRTLLRQVVLILALLGSLGIAIWHLVATSPTATGEPGSGEPSQNAGPVVTVRDDDNVRD